MTDVPKPLVFEPPEPPPVRMLRRLPWQSPEGRPANLIADGGYLSRLADDIERQQLATARTVWDLAPAVLDDPRADRDAVRFAALRLRESLGDLLQLTAIRELYAVAVPTLSSPYVRRWTYEPRCVGEARRDLHRVLLAWEFTELAERAELVLSELLTNAIRHADAPDDGEVETRYERLPAGIRIEVHDVDEARPLPHHPTADAETGRGLALVDALTGGQWGSDAREGLGKRVWAVVQPDAAAGEAAV